MAESSNSKLEELILFSYQPREAQLQIPDTLDKLDLVDPKVRYKSGHVPLSLNPAPTRSTKVAHKDVAPLLSNAGVRGMVTKVSHGTFHGTPATLVVFSFSFRSGDHGFRFKNANVKITFERQPSAAAGTYRSPAIAKFAPRKIFGLPTVEGKKNRIGGEIALQVPTGIVSVGPKVKVERESEYEKEHRFKTVGNFWSSKRGSDWDIVYWDVRENKKTKHGIPDRLNAAVVVERDGPFMATVEITVDTPLMNGIFGFPWSKDSPVAFVPGLVMGEPPKSLEFDKLTDADWREMIPYDGEWQDKLTDTAIYRGEEERSARGLVGDLTSAKPLPSSEVSVNEAGEDPDTNDLIMRDSDLESDGDGDGLGE